MSEKIKCFFLEWVDREKSNLMRCADTGEVRENHEWGPGAMFWAPWMDGIYSPQLEHVLIVRTPGGDWTVDSEANNCTKPNRPRSARRGRHEVYGRYQEDHHCWIIHGTVPEITVDKNGITCGAGAGSIGQAKWHGFLTAGYLEEC